MCQSGRKNLCLCLPLSLFTACNKSHIFSFFFFPLFWHLKKSQVSRLTEWNMFFGNIFFFFLFVLECDCKFRLSLSSFFGFCVTVKMQNSCHVYSVSKHFKFYLVRLDCQGLIFIQAHYQIRQLIYTSFWFRICSGFFCRNVLKTNPYRIIFEWIFHLVWIKSEKQYQGFTYLCLRFL